MVYIEDLIDEARLTKYHYWIFTLCIFVVFFDGYDGAALAFAAPALIADLHFDAQTLGPVFSGHLIGMVIGSSLFGIIADRFGRRPVIIVATALYGFFTIMSGTAETLDTLMVFRVLTGLGLGGAVSNAVAISAEYAPLRIRATVVSVVYSSFPLGSVLGGYLAIWLIEDFGWRSIFTAGGGVTLPLLLILIVTFPESVRYLCEAGASAKKIEKILAKIGLPVGTAWQTRDHQPTRKSRDSAIKPLFVDGVWRSTFLIWLCFFVNQLAVYFLFMWMPVVLKSRGLNNLGIVASATQSLGGVAGAFFLARAIDHHGQHRVLILSYVAAFILMGAVGSAAPNGAIVLISVVACCGFALNGSNVNLAGVAASLYPTASRSTGVGWAMAIGRAGGIVGSLIGSVLLQEHMSLSVLYPLAASPLLLASGAMWRLKKDRVPRTILLEAP